MPKLKTRKSAKKRIKITGTGKMLRRHVCTSHLKTKQSSKTKRRKSKMLEVAKADQKRFKRMIPYR